MTITTILSHQWYNYYTYIYIYIIPETELSQKIADEYTMIWNKIRTCGKDGGVVWVSSCQEVISCLICSLFGCYGFLPSVGQTLLVIVHIIVSYFRVCLWYQYSTPVNNYRNIFKIESSSAQFSNPAWIGWRSADSLPHPTGRSHTVHINSLI